MGLAIGYIEVDSFMASSEQLRRGMRGRPLVGVHELTRPGVVASVSTEARQAGVMAGVDVESARRLLGNKLVVSEIDVPYAKSLATEVFGMLREVALPSCWVAIDEMAVDLRYARDELGQDALAANRIIERFRTKVRTELGLTMSVGVAGGRYSAKVASQQARVGGVRVVADSEWPEWWGRTPVAQLAGVRQIDADVLRANTLRTVRDVRVAGRERLERLIGRVQGAWLWELASGNDPIELPPESAERLILTHEERFQRGEGVLPALEEALRRMNTLVAGRLLHRRSTATLLRVRIRTANGVESALQSRLAATRAFGNLQSLSVALLEELLQTASHDVLEMTLTAVAQVDTARPSLWDETHSALQRRDGDVPNGYTVAHPTFGDGTVLGVDSELVRVLFPDKDRWLRVSQVWDDSEDSLVRIGDVEIPDF
jgi:DNA polymerase-4